MKRSSTSGWPKPAAALVIDAEAFGLPGSERAYGARLNAFFVGIAPRGERGESRPWAGSRRDGGLHRLHRRRPYPRGVRDGAPGGRLVKIEVCDTHRLHRRPGSGMVRA
ncbi:MAG: hypothetical protein ABR529_10465, partial [Actinomycetota bacterium]